MGIYMYDVKFGDCFQLTKDLFPEGLVVDFGSMSASPCQFKSIVEHFGVTKPKQLLLSHFHLDHISGLLFMIENNFAFKFQEILIPDVFSTRGLCRAIVLLYLDNFLDSCDLPQRGRSRQYTLLEFIKCLCINHTKVTLLKRGDLFHRIGSDKTCTVLWPDDKDVADYADKLLKQLNIGSAIIRELMSASEISADLILSLTESEANTLPDSHQETLSTIQEQLDNIFDSYRIGDHLLSHQTRLRDFAHLVNIVFHNSISGESNFLFTGDIERNAMRRIEENPDGKSELNLHKQYKYIKIPHHGTSNHFYNFSSYSPTNILISNGEYRNAGYMIAKEYAKLYCTKSKRYCSNCNWCEQWMLSLSCDQNCDRQIIYDDIQKYIP